MQLSKTDLQYLGMKYTNPRSVNPNLLDINVFLNDFIALRKSRNLQRGDYSGIHNIQQDQYGVGG